MNSNKNLIKYLLLSLCFAAITITPIFPSTTQNIQIQALLTQTQTNLDSIPNLKAGFKTVSGNSEISSSRGKYLQKTEKKKWITHFPIKSAKIEIQDISYIINQNNNLLSTSNIFISYLPKLTDYFDLTLTENNDEFEIEGQIKPNSNITDITGIKLVIDKEKNILLKKTISFTNELPVEIYYTYKNINNYFAVKSIKQISGNKSKTISFYDISTNIELDSSEFEFNEATSGSVIPQGVPMTLTGSGTDQPAKTGIGYAIGGGPGGFSTDEIQAQYGTIGFSEQDLFLPGISNGLNLSISRTYNSRHYNSSATANIVFGKLWGSWIGHGWSFSFAKRAFIVETKEEFASSTNNKIIIESNGYMDTYVYNSTENAYISEKRGNFSLASYEPNNKIVLQDTMGHKYIFEENFYNESHTINNNNLLNIKGYYLTKITDQFDNKISFSYEKFRGTDYEDEIEWTEYSDVEFKEEKMLFNVIGSIYQSLETYLDGKYQDGTVSFNSYVLSNHIIHKRPKTITDTFDRDIHIGYEDIRNLNQTNKETMVTDISYTNSNSEEMSLKYSYDIEGNLTSVQLDDLPAKTYSYKYYSNSFAQYEINSLGKTRKIVDWIGESGGTIIDRFDFLKGYLLEVRSNPLGNSIRYTWHDHFESISNISYGMRFFFYDSYLIPQATYPKIRKKEVFNDGVLENSLGLLNNNI